LMRVSNRRKWRHPILQGNTPHSAEETPHSR
jgi:hypothetical protein